MAVAFPNLKQLVGLEQFGQSGTIEDRNPGKEKVTYDIRKAFTMWRNMNPNAIEMLWVIPQHVLQTSVTGQLIRANRDLFSSQYLYTSYKGYALGQLEKMTSIDKKDLAGYMQVCDEMKYRGIHPQHKEELGEGTVSLRSTPDSTLFQFYKTYLNQNSNLGKLGEKRKRLILTHGYDTKNACHMIRLLNMSIQFLLTGVLNVYCNRDERQKLLDIKNGKYSLIEVKGIGLDLVQKLDKAKKMSTMREKPDDSRIESFLIELIQNHYCITLR